MPPGFEPGHTDYKSVALPIELWPECVLRSMTVYLSLTDTFSTTEIRSMRGSWMERLDSNQRPVLILAFGT